MPVKHDVTNLGLAKDGKNRIELAGRQMPVLKEIQRRFLMEKPLKGIRIAACLHVTSETANLMVALKSGGAQVSLCASNPLSTQDEVAASLVKDFDIPVFARNGEKKNVYYAHIDEVLDRKPHMTMDDGADLVTRIHKDRRDLLEGIIGGTEETTTGVIRLRALEKEGKLEVPILPLN